MKRRVNMVSTRSKGQLSSSPKQFKPSQAPKVERQRSTIPVYIAVAPVLLALFIYFWYYTGLFSDADHVVCDGKKQEMYFFL